MTDVIIYMRLAYYFFFSSDLIGLSGYPRGKVVACGICGVGGTSLVFGTESSSDMACLLAVIGSARLDIQRRVICYVLLLECMAVARRCWAGFCSPTVLMI